MRQLGPMALMAFSQGSVKLQRPPKHDSQSPGPSWLSSVPVKASRPSSSAFGAQDQIPAPLLCATGWLGWLAGCQPPNCFGFSAVAVIWACQHCPSAFAVGWAGAALLFCWLNAGLNGTDSPLLAVSLTELPPLTVTAQFLCSWGLIVLYGVWYLSRARSGFFGLTWQEGVAAGVFVSRREPYPWGGPANWHLFPTSSSQTDCHWTV